MDVIIITLLPLFLAWMLDLIFGDPARLPHLIVYFGKAIAYFEHRLNKGKHRVAKGACVAIGLIIRESKSEIKEADINSNNTKMRKRWDEKFCLFFQ